MAKEVDKIIAKQYGRNLITFIKGVKYSKKTKDNEEVKSICLKIEMFNKKPSKDRLAEIIMIFSDSAKKEAKDKMEKKGLEKVLKKEEKKSSVKGTKANNKKNSLDLVNKVKDFYKKSKIKDDVSSLLVPNNDGLLSMKGCEVVPFPDLFIKRIEEFIAKQTEIKSLLNFWSLCLLNPNEVARTKLFDYLVDNGLTITPSGYFITYRMVKDTSNINIYTDAHTNTMKYVPGTVCSIPRTECDEDGSKDCSRGLHTGTPLFIGIKASKKITGDTKGILGDGYEITTKAADNQSYGTGYDRPSTQRFDNSFGNQAIICLVNPQHVVSIPDSNTRKMRSCEFYFAKLTTAEEVIDMVEKDYLLFDGDYQNFELKQLQELLKNKDLKTYVDSKEDENNTKIATLRRKLEKKIEEIKISNDKINTSLNIEAIKSIIKQRQIILK